MVAPGRPICVPPPDSSSTRTVRLPSMRSTEKTRSEKRSVTRIAPCARSSERSAGSTKNGPSPWLESDSRVRAPLEMSTAKTARCDESVTRRRAAVGSATTSTGLWSGGPLPCVASLRIFRSPFASTLNTAARSASATRSTLSVGSKATPTGRPKAGPLPAPPPESSVRLPFTRLTARTRSPSSSTTHAALPVASTASEIGRIMSWPAPCSKSERTVRAPVATATATMAWLARSASSNRSFAASWRASATSTTIGSTRVTRSANVKSCAGRFGRKTVTSTSCTPVESGTSAKNVAKPSLLTASIPFTLTELIGGGRATDPRIAIVSASVVALPEGNESATGLAFAADPPPPPPQAGSATTSIGRSARRIAWGRVMGGSLEAGSGDGKFQSRPHAGTARAAAHGNPESTPPESEP